MNSSRVPTQPAVLAVVRTRPSRSVSVIVNGVCLRRGTASVSAMMSSSNAASTRPELEEYPGTRRSTSPLSWKPSPVFPYRSM